MSDEMTQEEYLKQNNALLQVVLSNQAAMLAMLEEIFNAVDIGNIGKNEGKLHEYNEKMQKVRREMAELQHERSLNKAEQILLRNTMKNKSK